MPAFAGITERRLLASIGHGSFKSAEVDSGEASELVQAGLGVASCSNSNRQAPSKCCRVGRCRVFVVCVMRRRATHRTVSA